MEDKDNIKGRPGKEPETAGGKHKQNEGLIRKDGEYYHTLLDTLPLGIQEIDSSGVILLVNKAYNRIYGYEEGEVIGKSIFDKLADDSEREKLSDYLKTLVAGQPPPTPFFERDRTKEGNIIDVQVDWNYRSDSKGCVIGFLSIITDVTKRKKTEAGLATIKDELENAIECTLDSIVICDTKRKIIRANRSFLDLTGYSKEEVQEKYIYEFMPGSAGIYETTLGEYVEITENNFSYRRKLATQLFETGDIKTTSGYLMRKDGKVLPVESTIALVYSAHRDVVGTVGVIRDITERNKAEKEIRDTKDFLENVIMTSIDGIVVTDTGGFMIKVNMAMEEITGYSKEELIGKHMATLRPPGEMYSLQGVGLRDKLLKDGRITGFQFNILRKDATIIDTEYNAVILRDKDNNIIGAVASLKDVTEQRRTQKEIKEAKNFLELIFKTSIDGLLVVDPEGRIVMSNDAVEVIFGYSKDELVNKTTSMLRPEGEVYSKEGKEFIEKLFEDGYVQGAERVGKRKDGTLIDIEINSILLKDDKGNYFGRLASFKDITERKEAERNLISYQKQLKSLASQITLSEERERRRFADHLHDQIGQQLFSIKISLEMLRKSLSTRENAAALGKTINAIQDVIDNTRSLTYEMSPPVLQQFDIGAALEWLVERTREQYDMNVTLNNDNLAKPLSDDVKSFLFQAVRELLTNIAKHAQARNAAIAIGRDSNYIRISVKDDGVGFAPSGKDSSNYDNKGYGLFSITERLEQFGGHLAITSQPHAGTLITLTAPLSNEG